MNNSLCIPERELADLLQGKLADDRLEQVVQHVDDCSSCQDTVQMLAEQSDTFANAWQGGVAEDSGESEPEYRQAVQDLLEGDSPAAAPPPIRSADPPVEQLGPYQLLEPLGSGGMGTVYKALHTKLKRHVALKVLPANRWTTAAAVARFEREMEAIGQLDHPHIVRASDAGQDRNVHYLAMDYVDGLDLSRVVNRLGRVSVAEACEVARQTAMALQCAHENKLVHRDIKPSNVMLTRDGQIKLLDLGLALLGDEHAFDQNELTTVGQLMGTLDYMSPEQGMDCHEVDIRADIYSLGATLYKLLTGRAPFSGQNYNTLLKKVVALANKPTPSVGSHRDDLPPNLVTVIDRMLSKDPQERYDTPQAVVEALAPFAAHANLASLSKRALRATPSDREVLRAGPLPRVAGGLSAPGKQVGKAAGQRVWGAPLAVALLFFAALAAAAFVIHLQTDRGELIVRAEAPDVRVIIKRNGKPVQEMQLEQGENRLTVRSGKYQIELLGQSDELELTQNSLVVKRGQQVVVSIQRRDVEPTPDADMIEMSGTPMGLSNAVTDGTTGRERTGTNADVTGNGPMLRLPQPGESKALRSDSQPSLAPPTRPAAAGITPTLSPPSQRDRRSEPIYDGKPYSEWLAALEVERKPELLLVAVQAFGVLGNDDPQLAAESAAAIVRLMRRLGSRVVDAPHQARNKLMAISRDVLLAMPADIVLDTLKQELVASNTRSRAFVNYVLGPAYSTLSGHSYGAEGVEFLAAVNRSAEELTRLLVELPAGEVDSVRADALSLVP